MDRTIESSGGVVVAIDHEEICVLVGHRVNGIEEKWKPVLCQLPKGSLEPGESSEEAALREVKEETGYTARIIGFAGQAAWSFERGATIFHEDVKYYLMTLEHSRPDQADGEFERALWLSFDAAIATLSYPGEKAVVLSVRHLMPDIGKALAVL